jgi:hypothetical protein
MNHLLHDTIFINKIKTYIGQKSSDNIIDPIDVPQFMLYIVEVLPPLYKDYFRLDDILEEITFYLIQQYTILPNETEQAIKDQISFIKQLIKRVKDQKIKKSLFKKICCL